MVALIIILALLGLVIILRSGLRAPQPVIYIQTAPAEHHAPGGCALVALLATAGLLLLALLG
ncbi:MAG TPA: hypothetical protein VFS21_12335 [Roseiflexaceae bacterium]|nr:hypothetical protein [Roseiflexaceae bacterium]